MMDNTQLFRLKQTTVFRILDLRPSAEPTVLLSSVAALSCIFLCLCSRPKNVSLLPATLSRHKSTVFQKNGIRLLLGHMRNKNHANAP